MSDDYGLYKNDFTAIETDDDMLAAAARIGLPDNNDRDNNPFIRMNDGPSELFGPNKKLPPAPPKSSSRGRSILIASFLVSILAGVLVCFMYGPQIQCLLGSDCDGKYNLTYPFHCKFKN